MQGRNTDTDALKASAFASMPNALPVHLLARFFLQNDVAAYRCFLDAWVPYVEKRAVKRRWCTTLTKTIAQKSLQMFGVDVCPTCCGRRYKKVENAPVLSDEFCTACKGTGRLNKSIYVDAHIADLVVDCHDLLSMFYADFMRSMRKKLKD